MKLYLGLAAAFVGLVVLANWLASAYVWHVPLTPYRAPAGVFCVGAVLVLRDWLQQVAARLQEERMLRRAKAWPPRHKPSGLAYVMPLVYLSGLVSWAIGDLAGWTGVQKIAVASVVAFSVSETVEALVFTPLRKRYLARAVALSATVGNAIDSWLFLTLAFGSGSLALFYWGNFFGKLEMVAVGVLLTACRRAVLPVPTPA